MPTRLRFPLNLIAAHIGHARSAPRHFHGLAGPVGPALEFVKDEGIYLLSNGGTADLEATEDPTRPPEVYAEGYDPTVDDRMQVWEQARAAVGGDDFVEFIELDESFLSAFSRATSAGCTYLAIDITPRDFTITFL